MGRITLARPNAKLRKLGKARGTSVKSLDLPAGYSCPGARECRSRAVKTTKGWRIRDGRHCRFRCYAASVEVIFPRIHKARMRNMKALQRCGRNYEAMTDMIDRSIPRGCRMIRLHSSGDFFSYTYFRAIICLAYRHRDILFYGYTKALHFWAKYIDECGFIPPNLILTASYGGKYDHLIKKYGFRSCRVVLSPDEAAKLGLMIDHDDTLASTRGPDFCVLIHGTQPVGSEEGKAVRRNRDAGIGGYRRYKRGYGLKKKGKAA